MVSSGDQVRRYYMTRMEIWKVFGVYYITKVDLTNKYKTTLCFASPKESFNGHWTTFSSSSSSFVCVRKRVRLDQWFSMKHCGFYLKQNTNIQNTLKISTHYYLYVNISLKIDIAIAH